MTENAIMKHRKRCRGTRQFLYWHSLHRTFAILRRSTDDGTLMVLLVHERRGKGLVTVYTHNIGI